MSASKNYYDGCILLKNKQDFSFKSVNYAGVWLDKDNYIPNPVYFQRWSNDILEKLYYVSSKEYFSTFITLTTKDDLEVLNKLLTTITKYYNRYFSLDSIQRDNRHIISKEQAIEFRKEQITKFAELEVDHILKKSNSSIQKGSDNYNGLLKDITYRLETSPISDINYIRVTELQHNEEENPHFHILSTHYVPETLIELVLDNNKIWFENSRIFDVSYILDNYLRKNKDLFQKYKNNKPEFYQQIQDSKSYKNSLIGFSLQYVTKYIVKEPTKTYVKLKQKGYDNFSIARFSNGFYNKYPELRRQDSKFNKLGRIPKPLKVPTYDYQSKSSVIEQINFDDELNIESTENHYQEIDDRTAYIDFLNSLRGSGLFNFHENNSFQKILNDFKSKDLDYLTQHNSLDLKELGLTTNSNLYDELKSKYVVSKVLRHIYDKQVLYRFKESTKKIKQVYSNLQKDKYQLEVLNQFQYNPLLNIIGRAGAGKTWTLSNLGVFNDETTKFIVLTKKKRATQRLKQKYEDLGFNNVHLENIDSFLIKRGDIYVKNELNCIDEEKEYVLILDEIGQITYDELYSVFAGINIDKIIRVVFGGDICQDKSFYGNSILDMLKDLDFVKELELKNNWRSNDNLNTIFNQFLENKTLENYNILDFYQDKDKFKDLLKEKLNQDYTFIVNSKKLRDHVNQLCLELSGTKKVLVDVNNRRYNITNGDLYYIQSQTSTHYNLVEDKTNKKLKIPNYIFDKHFIYAFALTVDKTQGDEFENVCVLFDDFSHHLQTHNKLYTAMTRAKSNLDIWFENSQVYQTCISKHVTNDDLFLYKNIDEVIDILDGLNQLDTKLLVQQVNEVYFKV